MGAGGIVNFIMLNPSTATDTVDDATIRKCCGFAKRWGYRGIVVTNLFAYRATEPRDLQKLLASSDTWDIAKGGRRNFETVLDIAAKEADLIVCAWGEHGRLLWHASELIEELRKHLNLSVIGLTRNGKPLHPSRAPYTDAPMAWLQKRLEVA